MIRKKDTVVVAMSGGIDSTLAAAMIKAQGYETIGVSLRMFRGNETAPLSQDPRQQGIEFAAEMARRIDIPHQIIDVHEEFNQHVVETFCREYLSGRTPNPCIVCNEKIKLGILLSRARKMGASFLATGHYSQVFYDEHTGRYVLKKGADKEKDQSYFLFSLSQKQLQSVLFPLGGLTKTEVRQRAKGLGLTMLERTESQEICFVPDNDYPLFIQARFPELVKRGPVVSTSGELLGEHKGIFSFTIGQRKGLHIARGHPLYVVALDKETNTVIVGKKEEVYRTELIASKTNWITMASLEKPLLVKARIRYRNPEQHAHLIPLSNEKVKVVFLEPPLALTPGQAVVFYDGDMVVGGGWIE
ncbi:MAG: tRNA 2-thiouridine(34) synthase MnmA [Deltaproteobacteria bacterium]|nr:tRNA 2-thiouridine(34) synthase MnmA [Deltaproteobacteria bacterium]